MWKKILLVVVILVLGFLGYVSTKEGKFHYEASGVIPSTPEKIFPYLSQFKLGGLWSPYEKVDPNMQKEFSGVDGEVGATMTFKGNKDAGAGKLEILKIVPNQSVEIKLTMTEPMFAENIVIYTLAHDPNGTLFTWGMKGDGGFLGKLVGTLIDCEKMITDQFKEGINNLKTLMEQQNKEGGVMNLTETPEIIDWPDTHYVFVEKRGPFMEAAPRAWGEFHTNLSKVINSKRAPQMLSLYKIHPQMIYRAGAIVTTLIDELPPEFKYEKFAGGKYAKFILKGSYSQLAQASGRVMEIVKESKLSVRDAFYIENYVNSPSEVPEDQLITEILVPIK